MPDPSDTPNVIIDLGSGATSETPRATAQRPARGNSLVVVVYVLATAALAASIYARWFT